MSGVPRSAVLAGTALLLAACSAGGSPGESAAAEAVRPPPGDVSITVFTERSQVRVGTADVGRSSVDVRIAEILSAFDTRRSAEGSVVTLPEQVLFDFDSAALKPEAGATLDRIAEALELAGERRVTIRGHTDSRGDDAYNLDLSTRRAEAVRAYFTTPTRLAPQRFESVGLGETKPVAPNERPDGSDDPAGRQQNRRVEIVLRGR